MTAVLSWHVKSKLWPNQIIIFHPRAAHIFTRFGFELKPFVKWVPKVQHGLDCTARADSRFVPSQWETALLCNNVSHLLGASLESALTAVPCVTTEIWMSQYFQPMAAHLSMKAALPLARNFTTALYRSSNSGHSGGSLWHVYGVVYWCYVWLDSVSVRVLTTGVIYEW